MSQLIGLKILKYTKVFLQLSNLNLEQNSSLTALAIESEVPLFSLFYRKNNEKATQKTADAQKRIGGLKATMRRRDQ